LNTDPPHTGEIEEILARWGLEHLAQKIVVEYSPRLRRSLGRTRVDDRRVRLNVELVDADPALRAEVLCHELAHIAVHEIHGCDTKPHGPEWRELVTRAGYDPATRIAVPSGNRRELRRPKRFEHVCPVCQCKRYAGRPMRLWRCRTCYQAGLDGRLVIREASA